MWHQAPDDLLASDYGRIDDPEEGEVLPGIRHLLPTAGVEDAAHVGEAGEAEKNKKRKKRFEDQLCST